MRFPRSLGHALTFRSNLGITVGYRPLVSSGRDNDENHERDKLEGVQTSSVDDQHQNEGATGQDNLHHPSEAFYISVPLLWSLILMPELHNYHMGTLP